MSDLVTNAESADGEEPPTAPGMTVLRARFLGNFTLSPTSLRVDTERLQSLLAYLIIYAETPLRREQVAAALWPEHNEGTARTRLRKGLFDLQQTLTPLGDILCTERARVGWRADVMWHADVREFQQLSASLHGQSTDCRDQIQRLRQLTDIYQGELLPGCYWEWIEPLRQELRRDYVSAQQHLVDHLAANGDYAQALHIAHRILAEDPLHHDIYRRIIELHALNNDAAAVQRVYQLYTDVLAREQDAPPLPVVHRAYRRALAMTRPRSPGIKRLPSITTHFVGRTREIREVAARLQQEDCRLLTITGPGGIGKTRLAVRVADSMDAFAHGVAFVPLVGLEAGGDVAAAMAAALQLSGADGDSATAALLEHLRPKSFLLVLDNYEHLREQTAVLRAILEQAPDVKLLVTSRVRLGLADEWVYALDGLDSLGATSPDEAMPDAVRLFDYHAQRVRPGFAVNDDLDAVVEICRLVGGMPLAVELAATWTRTVPLQQIAAEIAANLDFLADPTSDRVPRQRSMHATFDRSWDLLTAGERETLMALSVLRGTFSLDAGLAVTQGTLTDLSGLHDKSMIQRGEDGRYSLHELIRQYCAEKLNAHPEAAAGAHRRHAEFYAALVARHEENLTVGSSAPFQALAPEWHNILSAWHWILDQCDAPLFRHMAVGFTFYYEGQGWFSEGLHTLQQALAVWEQCPQPDAATQACIALAQMGCGLFATLRGAFADGVAYAGACAPVFRAARAYRDLGLAYMVAGIAQTRMGKFDEAIPTLTDCVTYSQKANFVLGQGAAYLYLGDIARYGGDFVEAERNFHKSLHLAQKTNSYRGLGETFLRLGHLAYDQQECELAGNFYRESLTIAQAHHDEWVSAEAAYRLGLVACAIGQADTAMQHFQAALHAAGNRQGNLSAMLNVLYGTARVAATLGMHERAVEYLTAVVNHPAAFSETKEAARRTLAEVERSLSTPQLKFARTKGLALNLSAAVEAVLSW